MGFLCVSGVVVCFWCVLWGFVSVCGEFSALWLHVVWCVVEGVVWMICCFCVLQGFGCGVVVECLWYGCGLHIQGDFWRGVHLHCVCVV